LSTLFDSPIITLKSSFPSTMTSGITLGTAI
jgi:hypothetical protein